MKKTTRSATPTVTPTVTPTAKTPTAGPLRRKAQSSTGRTPKKALPSADERSLLAGERAEYCADRLREIKAVAEISHPFLGYLIGVAEEEAATLAMHGSASRRLAASSDRGL